MTDWPIDDYEGYALVSLMGHLTYKGWVQRAYLAGVPVLKVTVTEVDQTTSVRYVAAGALYSLRPSTEVLCKPRPVVQYADPFAEEDGDDLEKSEGDGQ